jgi:ferredoxin
MGEDGLAMVIDDDPPAETYPDIEACVALCPVAAIIVAAV